MAFRLSRSYAYCERLARREAGNFYHAFTLLPRPKRRAMCALYAFLRVTDDLTDDASELNAKRTALADWRRQWQAALAGEYTHPLHAAFVHVVRTYRIPPIYIEEALTGVGMDLEADHYETFAELYRYCYRVASVVGLSCIHIWGFTGEKALASAEAAGVAFQLTNILRDLAEDAGRGRVYLPQEDLRRFGCREEELAHGGEHLRELMRFEAARAYGYYDAGRPLVERLDPAGQAVFLVMLRTYRGLLDEIVRRDFDVFSGRVRLSRWHKLWLAAKALPVRFGWV
jgi:phytoene synthase